MLQRDYIQRLIREFMAALERMLEKKEVDVRKSRNSTTNTWVLTPSIASPPSRM